MEYDVIGYTKRSFLFIILFNVFIISVIAGNGEQQDTCTPLPPNGVVMKESYTASDWPSDGDQNCFAIYVLYTLNLLTESIGSNLTDMSYNNDSGIGDASMANTTAGTSCDGVPSPKETEPETSQLHDDGGLIIIELKWMISLLTVRPYAYV